MQSATDIPLLIDSPSTSSERRISPAWTIWQLKGRLESVTGVPPSAQALSLRLSAGQTAIPLTSNDEETTQLSTFPLAPYATILVADTRPAAAQLAAAITDTSNVPKYEMPAATYETLPSTVLAYKKTHQLGRFDPAAPSREAQREAHSWREVTERRIELGARCALRSVAEAAGAGAGEAKEDGRRGTVRFIGAVPETKAVGAWVGVELDEPTGNNDGSLGESRYFTCGPRCGAFVRPERVEVGDFPALDEFAEEMEEM